MEALDLIKGFANISDNVWLRDKANEVETEINKLKNNNNGKKY